MFSRVVSNFRKKRRRNEQNITQSPSSPELSRKIEKFDIARPSQSFEYCELNKNASESLSSVECTNDSCHNTDDDNEKMGCDKGVYCGKFSNNNG
jgi:hypothetical protein